MGKKTAIFKQILRGITKGNRRAIKLYHTELWFAVASWHKME